MKNIKNKLKSIKGITLISLVVTIIILIILASISITMLLRNNGLLNKAQTASDETNKSQATETMNLKITNIQILSYTETQKLPNLQYLADKLCEDNDMEYVLTASKEHASLEKIDVTNLSSIYTKLKDYPYEFEINSSLQLASIDGVKLATVPSNDDDTIVSMTKKELETLIDNRIKAQSTPSTSANTSYSTDEKVIGTWTDGKPIYRKVTYFNCSISDLNGASTGITNGEILISSNLYGTESSGYKWFMDGTNRATWLNNTLSIIYTNNTYKGTVVFGVFEYTKTTDEAQSN